MTSKYSSLSGIGGPLTSVRGPTEERRGRAPSVDFEETNNDYTKLIQPGKPEKQACTSDSITISWEKPTLVSSDTKYEIKYKKASELEWTGSTGTRDGSQSIKISRLQSGTKYVFKVCYISGDKKSPFSERSDDMMTDEKVGARRSQSEPGIPMIQKTTSSSISIYWEEPEKDKERVINYDVKYRVVGEKQWKNKTTDGKEVEVEITQLQANTAFQFKVRALTDDGEEGPYSEISNNISTRASLALTVKKMSKKMRDGCPIRLRPPLKSFQTPTIRKCVFADTDKKAKEKNIMLVGATGAGKSTLIDGMFNYILDVSWEDEFRFSLSHRMEGDSSGDSIVSENQTDLITLYAIKNIQGSRIDFNLNIIDIPGFYDEGGISRDMQIIDKIEEFFYTAGDQGISSLDAICFVTQAPQATFTPLQKYIFDAILSVFGDNLKNNIFILITFADGNEPPVLAALQKAEIPCQKNFVFNNSALFANNQGSGGSKFSSMFWNLGKESFKTFFTELSDVQSRRLQQTLEVLQTRKKMKASIDRLQTDENDGSAKSEVELYQKDLKRIALRPNPLDNVEYINLLIETERKKKKVPTATLR